MVVELVFETHSITEDNERGIATGWLPGRLSERGRALAVEMGARHRDGDIAQVFTSDLQRAIETASIAFPATTTPILHDRRLRECDYGGLNGARVERLAPRSRFVTSPFPGGESYRDVVTRMQAFLIELAPYQERRVLLIGHSATRWALEHLLVGRRLEELVDAPFDWQPGWRYRLE